MIERDALKWAAESAVTDETAYRTARGTATYDDERVGRMLAREPHLARGALDLLGEVARLETRRDELLALAAKLTRDVPYEEESRNVATLIAKVGTLKSALREACGLLDSAVGVIEECMDNVDGESREVRKDIARLRKECTP